MGKSLTETAKAILMEGGIPSVSPMDAGHPDRDATSSTPLKASLKPGSKYKENRFANPNANSDFEGAEDLGGATPTSTAKENLGAKAAAKVGKDTSKSSQSTAPVKSQGYGEGSSPSSKLDEDIEISEELEAFIAELTEQGYSEEEIAEAIEENFEIVSEEKEEDEKEDENEEEKEDEKEDEEDKKEKHSKMMKEHVDALLAGENLSEDFRSKAETIFESAVNLRVNEEVKTLEEAYAAALEEEVAKIRAELTEQVDDYLNYVVEQWVEENEVAIDTGLRTELTEDFISGLKNLFAEHYIDIPEDKVSVVEELGSKVEELEAKLNEEIDRNVQLTKQINESKQFEVLVDACEGLTTTQAEKLKALAENVDFTSVEEYAAKIETLKESYFPNNTVKADKVLDTVDSNAGMISEETTGRMSAYVKALGTKLPK